MKLSYLCLGLVAALLGFVMAVQTGLVASKLKFTGKSEEISLQKDLPKDLPGWHVEELPIGPTETESTAVARMLNFDQLLYRRYSSPKGSFNLYVAYWSPQKMSPNLVGSHTPDRCWVLSGWTCEAESFSWTCVVDHRELYPAQYRVFRNAAGEPQQVIYWHLSGGKPFGGDYHINGTRSVLAYWKSVFLYHAGRNDAQFFIRLNSEHPFANFWNDPGFRQLMSSLAKLCLANPKGRVLRGNSDFQGRIHLISPSP